MAKKVTFVFLMIPKLWALLEMCVQVILFSENTVRPNRDSLFVEHLVTVCVTVIESLPTHSIIIIIIMDGSSSSSCCGGGGGGSSQFQNRKFAHYSLKCLVIDVTESGAVFIVIRLTASPYVFRALVLFCSCLV
jgi:hypothetical protein